MCSLHDKRLPHVCTQVSFGYPREKGQGCPTPNPVTAYTGSGCCDGCAASVLVELCQCMLTCALAAYVNHLLRTHSCHVLLLRGPLLATTSF